MNQKSLKDLKHLTSEIVNNPKLINKLDEIRVRYSEIIEKLEDPETYKDHKLSEKLNKERSKLEKPVKYFLDFLNLIEKIKDTEHLISTEEDKDLKVIAEDDLQGFVKK